MEHACVRLVSVPVDLVQVAAFFGMIVFRSTAWSLAAAVLACSVSVASLATHVVDPIAWLTGTCATIALVVTVLAGDVTSGNFLRQLWLDLVAAVRSPQVRWQIAAGTLAFLSVAEYTYLRYALSRGPGASADRLVAWFDRRQSGPSVTIASLDIYSDYQCPYCRLNTPTLIRTAAAFGLVAQLRDFPLDSACNPAVPSPALHPVGCDAAVAMRIVATSAEERGEDFQRWLFTNQTRLSRTMIRRRLQEWALRDKFDTAYEFYLKQVTADIERGVQLGVSATPAIVLNGLVLPTSDPTDLEALLAHLVKGRRLQSAGSKRP
jgi:hypothetical protein